MFVSGRFRRSYASAERIKKRVIKTLNSDSECAYKFQEGPVCENSVLIANAMSGVF